MKKNIYLFFVMILLSCGMDSLPSNSGGPMVSVTGVFLDSETSFDLFKAFEEVKQCSGLEKGSFLDLSITFRQRSGICDAGCDGKFSSPNTIMVSSFSSKLWRHEFLHYLFFSNSFGSNPNHSASFVSCAELVSGSGPPDSAPRAAAELSLSPTTFQDLFHEFKEVKTCTKLAKGSFSELSIMFRQDSKICNGGCAGTFVTPNIIILSSFDPQLWHHEFLHYLLFVNIGNPDSSHTSKFFGTCAQRLNDIA